MVPGHKRAAVRLRITGKITESDLNRLLGYIDKKVTYDVKRFDFETAEIMIIGSPITVQRLVNVFCKDLNKCKVGDVKQFWFNKLFIKAKRLDVNPIDMQISKQASSCKTYILTFAGNTSLGDYYLSKPGYERHYKRLVNNPLSFFEGFKPLTTISDYAVINFDSALIDNPTCFAGGRRLPNWDNPKRTVDVFKQLGISAVSLANDRVMNFGPDIMLKTKKEFEKAGICCVGAAENLERASKPIRLKFQGDKSSKVAYIFTGVYVFQRHLKDYHLNASKEKPGVNLLGASVLSRIVANIAYIRKTEPDALIIFFPHLRGLNYKQASQEVGDFCEKLLDAGADYILAHGSRMFDYLINKYEKRTNVIALGNFVFNSPGLYGKFNALPYSVIVNLELSEEKTGWQVSQKVYPFMSDNRINEFKAKLVNESEIDKFSKFNHKESQRAYSNIFQKDSKGIYYLTTEKVERNIMAMNLKPTEEIIKNTVLNKKTNIYSERSYKVADLIKGELEKCGCQVGSIDNLVVDSNNNRKKYFYQSVTSNTSLLGAMLLNNKNLARKLFVKSGITVAKGKLFTRSQREQAKHFALSLSSAVVKPVDSDQGRGVTVGVNNSAGFVTAWNNAAKFSKRGVLIEEQFTNGSEARFLVVGGKCVAVFKKIPPHIIGDGHQTISQLVEQKKRLRVGNPYLKNKPITLNEHRLSILKQQGYSMSSIPSQDDIVIIDYMSSTSTGGESIDITEDVHPSFNRIAELVVTIAPGLDLIGVDILAFDYFQEAKKDKYIVIEANARPCLGVHLYPVYGKPRNVVGEIVKYMSSLAR